jgi:hypothetical protein
MRLLVKVGRVCIAILYSTGLYSAEPVNPQVNPMDYTLVERFTDVSCKEYIRAYGVSTACRLPNGAVPNRLHFTHTPQDFMSLCGLDREGFRLFCITGSARTTVSTAHLDTGRFNGTPSEWGLVAYSPYPYDIAEFEYGPGFAWIELYPQTGLAGGRLCVMALGLDSSQSACNGVGRQARSAKIFGLHNPGKPYWVCFRTPTDEANRCYSSKYGNASQGHVDVMDIDSTSPPQYGAIRVKGGSVAGSLYSVDFLQ